MKVSLSEKRLRRWDGEIEITRGRQLGLRGRATEDLADFGAVAEDSFDPDPRRGMKIGIELGPGERLILFAQVANGVVEVICGSMFSGKTEELLRRVRRAQIARHKIQVFKPTIDDRYSADHVQSHNANRILSRPVEKARDILKYVEDNTRVVGIDEAQFFDDGIVEVAQKLAYRGIRVIVAGLDMDFRGQPFGPMPKLLAIAEEVTKLSAVCMVCGNPASRSQRLAVSEVPGDAAPDLRDAARDAARIAVGAKEMYEARCRFCHEPDQLVTAVPVAIAGLTKTPGEPAVQTTTNQTGGA